VYHTVALRVCVVSSSSFSVNCVLQIARLRVEGSQIGRLRVEGWGLRIGCVRLDCYPLPGSDEEWSGPYSRPVSTMSRMSRISSIWTIR